MGRNKNQLSLDITTGEDIYFGKPENRRDPVIGDECYVLYEGEYYLAKVIKVTPMYFMTESIDPKYPGLFTLPPGINKNKFRPKNF